MESEPDHPGELSVEMSDRHTGVGGDGIILIEPSEVADFKMRIFNADGSEARMCGNGSRCVGRYVYEKGLTEKLVISLETLGGIKTLYLHPDNNGSISNVTVDMGEPILDAASVPVRSDNDKVIDEIISTSQGSIRITAVSMGNPHGVVFVDNLDTIDIPTLGMELEHHPMWPDRANIEFARILGPSEIEMRVWERGSGETMACGTGACATVVAAVINRVISPGPVVVHLLGGDLTVDWHPGAHVMMTGNAVTVFEGTYCRVS